jgi:hypothetical protein
MLAATQGVTLFIGARRTGAALTWGCVASISRIEVGEASRRPRNVVKEPGPLIHADDNVALAA